MDTFRKHIRTVSHTLIKLKNMFCWKGSWKIYFIYFATVYVKLKELNFIIGKVKTSKVVLEQGRRCLGRNQQKKRKTQFLFSNWFKMSRTNKYVVHKVNTFFFSVKYEKFYLTLFRGRLAI